MGFHSKGADYALNYFGSKKDLGLSAKGVSENSAKFGLNVITKKKKRPLILKITDALSEPMILILLFSFALAFGINLGRFFKTGEGDFTECFGILAAVVLSVFITLFMEGSSEKAFAALGKMYGDASVKVIRDGQITVIKKDLLTAGDIIVFESGDKILADGRIIECADLSVDESALTGESRSVEKDAFAVLSDGAPLAERKNMVYSGTFVLSGSGSAVITAVGDATEIGAIAGELKNKKEVSSPLEQKLAKLSKTVSAIGAFFAALVFILSFIRLAAEGNLDFSNVQELFVSSIVLIVAAVPEGLPTIVAVSLALNMIKLAKENALIKKMIATETAGAVSVICSDKTGTLTTGKMEVESVCTGDFCVAAKKIKEDAIIKNFILNTTAVVRKKGKEKEFFGSGTECALVAAIVKNDKNFDCAAYRKKYPVIKRIPFTSKEKTMTTVIKDGDKEVEFIKGAPEKIMPLLSLTVKQRAKLSEEISARQEEAKRVLMFAHDEGGGYIYDGYAVIKDQIRKDAAFAVRECKKAGIKIKILTGDNYITALAVARELNVAQNKSEVINAADIEDADEETLKKILERVSVIARSTPATKLKVVKALKSMGEVVALTGDGINDAPAVKHADVGIAMGKNGSEITKEAADIILLDDSFSTIVKAVSFGRSVYRNLQKFIIFQLSVNVSALLIITVCAVLGVKSPFNTLQLLWINVIMDGPPALSLGLAGADGKLMSLPPVKRDKSIISAKMLLKIALTGTIVAAAILFQIFFNFMGVEEKEKSGAVFTTFILFQLFNAFNCIEIGKDSVFSSLYKNKITAFTFIAVFIVQVFIMQVAYPVFGVNPLSFLTWIKALAVSSTVVIITEIIKLIYRRFSNGYKTEKFFVNKKAKRSIN